MIMYYRWEEAASSRFPTYVMKEWAPSYLDELSEGCTIAMMGPEGPIVGVVTTFVRNDSFVRFAVDGGKMYRMQHNEEVWVILRYVDRSDPFVKVEAVKPRKAV